MQPGETITPGGSPPSNTPEPKAAAEAQPAPWQFSADMPANTDSDSITWTASEYMIHHKAASWYLLLILVTAVVMALAWLITHDTITVGVIGILGLVFGIGAARQPRVIDYSLDNIGLRMANHGYPYESFKSFTIVTEESINSIALLPLKRFIPGVTIYYPPEQEDEIVKILSNHLPHEERKLDPIDKLMHKLRY